MKKIVSLILAFAMVCLQGCCFAAPVFDLTPYKNSESVTIDVDQENGLAYINSTMSASERSFTHKYESEYYYSTFSNSIIVLDYYKSSRLPVFRTFVDYYAKKPLYVYEIAFILDGVEYTFSDDVQSNDNLTEMEHGICEEVVVVHGANNDDFMVALLENMASLLEQVAADDDVKVPDMQMILRGTEDVVVDVPGGFWLDFMSIITPHVMSAADSTDFADFLRMWDGTPCTTKTVATEI